MTPRDDERRKFEAWYALQTGFDKTPEHPEVLWHGWLARAEQAETPLDGPTSCTVCGAAMEFKCPSCGSTPAPTKPVQAKTPRAAEPTCKQCGFKQTDAIHFDPKYEFRHYYIEGVYVPSPIQHTKAAAPVEDRPAPTLKCGNEFALRHGYFCELPKGHDRDHEAECPNPQFHQSWPQVPGAPEKE